MKANTFICAACRNALREKRRMHLQQFDVPTRRRYHRPTFAPNPVLDLKHIRQNPGLYEQNSIDRNYTPYAKNGWKILELHEALVQQRRDVVEARQRNNVVENILKRLAAGQAGHDEPEPALREEARQLKRLLAKFEMYERETRAEMERLALELPNLSSQHTPVGEEPETIGWINGETPPTRQYGSRSHVQIGKELQLLDFEGSATTSGWGWYFLKNEGALLEQALIQFALSTAWSRGFTITTPPSLVYSHIASACGFMPRDQNGETQIYSINQDQGNDGQSANKPQLVLAGTAEIPFAGSQANKTFISSDLPLKVAGPSRCYRAEAGARGVDTKGLYRVHEFTKVEMFAWTMPQTMAGTSGFSGGEDESEPVEQADMVFSDMLSIQSDILRALGLHARILEMPTTDLGASASRKIDIEALFPSRTSIDQGYGEVTSVSMCGDYQARRLATRVKHDASGGAEAGALTYPHTLNGTALAVPRVLAAVLENGWDEKEGHVVIPPCLRKWMPLEMSHIGRKPS